MPGSANGRAMRTTSATTTRPSRMRRALRRRRRGGGFALSAGVSFAEKKLRAFETNAPRQISKLGRVAADRRAGVFIANITAEHKCLRDRIVRGVVCTGQPVATTKQDAARQRRRRILTETRIDLTGLEFDDIGIPGTEARQQGSALRSRRNGGRALHALLCVGGRQRQQQG